MKKQMIYLIRYNMKGSKIKKRQSMLMFCMIVFSYIMPVSASFFGQNSDFLEQVFSPSKSHQQVINI